MKRLFKSISQGSRLSTHHQELVEAFIDVEKSKMNKGKSIVQPFINHFSKEDICLDVGCGLGENLNNLSNITSKNIGLDVDSDVIKNCKIFIKNKDNTELILANALFLPFVANCYDDVMSFDVLEHLYDPKKSINEIYRVSKNKGRIIFGIPNKWSFSEIMLNLYTKVTKKISEKEWNVRHVSFIEPKYFKLFFSNYLNLKYLIAYSSYKKVFTGFFFTIISIYANIIYPPIKARLLLRSIGDKFPIIKQQAFFFDSLDNPNIPLLTTDYFLYLFIKY